jgi:photosystem II stability/assembly factor-like uncharacterized protein
MKKTIAISFSFLIMLQGIFAQWETVYFPVPTPQLPLLNAVAFSDFNNGIAVGYTYVIPVVNSVIVRTIDNGNTWNIVISFGQGILNDITFTNSSTAYAVGYGAAGGLIVKTTDSGSTWTSTLSTNTTSFNSVFFPSAYTGYACGTGGRIFKTTDSGITWNSLNTLVNVELTSIYFVNNNVGFSCGGNVLISTVDGGNNWSAITFPQNVGTYGSKLFFPSSQIGYCVMRGQDLYLYKTANQGANWNFVDSILPNSNMITSLFFTNDTTGYFTGQFLMFKTTDGGTTWNFQTATPPGSIFYDDLMDVFFLNNDTGFAVGAYQYYRTFTAGELFTPLNIKTNYYNENSISIFPNPAINQLTIAHAQIKINSIEIYDVLGEKRLTPNPSPKERGTSFSVDVSKLASGIYFVKVRGEKNLERVAKFVKQ